MIWIGRSVKVIAGLYEGCYGQITSNDGGSLTLRLSMVNNRKGSAITSIQVLISEVKFID